VTRTPSELAAIALTVAEEAGAVALAGWRSPLAVTRKGRTDLVTDRDLASEALMRRRLGELTAEIPMVGEEADGDTAVQSLRAGRVWYCDPIDGTTNYAHGHPHWCVSVGVLEDGEPLAGAVFAPVIRTHWTGYRGGPALRNGAPIQPSLTDDVTDAFVGTGFPYGDRHREPYNNFASFERVKRVVQAVRRCGSAALDCCFVAEGTYDGYWERVLKPWDVAGGLAVVLAAGGRVTHLDGSPAHLERGNLLVSNGRVHDALSRLIQGD
jgi:myo-inositol-1(or 4)-monophosphatase